MKTLNNPNGLADFEAIIKGLITDLENYALKPQAKQTYIVKQNKLIEKLTIVYNSIDVLQFYDVWISIEDIIKEIELKDKEISGYTIQLQMNPTGNNYCLITYNPFI